LNDCFTWPMPTPSLARFLGGHPRYEAPSSALMSGDSRFGHNVASTGVVKVEFNVVLKGFGSNVQTSHTSTADAQLSRKLDGEQK
jgi:hypothetical protein